MRYLVILDNNYDILGIIGMQNFEFSNIKLLPRSDKEGLRSGWYGIMILWPNYLCIGGSILGSCRWILELWVFRGRCNIRWGWKVIVFAPRIENNIKYVMRFKDAMCFAWQVQYLLNFKGEFTCSGHWKWPFICDTDYWWHLFFVAG